MSLHVSGVCDGAFLVVERVHTASKPPAGAVRVLRYPEKGRRKPRAGDRLDYNPGTRPETRFPPGAVRVAVPPYVTAPKRAKGGATPTGRGARVYLAADVAADLDALVARWGRPRGEVLAILIHGARIASGETVAAPPHLAGARVVERRPGRDIEGGDWVVLDAAHPGFPGEGIATLSSDVTLLPGAS